MVAQRFQTSAFGDGDAITSGVEVTNLMVGAAVGLHDNQAAVALRMETSVPGLNIIFGMQAPELVDAMIQSLIECRASVFPNHVPGSIDLAGVTRVSIMSEKELKDVTQKLFADHRDNPEYIALLKKLSKQMSSIAFMATMTAIQKHGMGSIKEVHEVAFAAIKSLADACIKVWFTMTDVEKMAARNGSFSETRINEIKALVSADLGDEAGEDAICGGAAKEILKIIAS